MNEQTLKIDEIDRKLLVVLQADASLSQRELAERIGLSQNACWRRLQRLQAAGVLKRQRYELDLGLLGIDLTVLVMIKTPHHAKEWAERFRAHVERLPGVVDLYRIGGEWDYMIKTVTRGIDGYDEFYRRLVDGFELSTVTGHFVMERMIEGRALDLR